jgi:glycosyltransferase involved in cell wall biosynthesis
MSWPRRWVYHGFCRMLVLAHRFALRVGDWFAPRDPRVPELGGLNLLLTGTIHSDNWIRAHLRPLAMARPCRQVTFVTTTRFAEIDRVRAVYPPRWLVRAMGSVAARCVVLAWLAVRERPDFVGGFHLLVNALIAQVIARVIGARSVYFCVAGVDEVADGGCRAENRVFGRMETRDRFVEAHLLRAIAAFDLVITMGTGAAEYFRRHGLSGECHVVAGGIDSGQYNPSRGSRLSDVVAVGRLVEIKRLDILLEAIALVVRRQPRLTATLVGDGPLRSGLEQMARALHLEHCVRFAGFQPDVSPWLAQAKLYVLSSDSEGVPLALMEAMMSGLPVVATDVGDIRDLVENGVCGFLVPRRTPAELAQRIVHLLADESRLAGFGQQARIAALRYDTGRVTLQWEAILARFVSASQPATTTPSIGG